MSKKISLGEYWNGFVCHDRCSLELLKEASLAECGFYLKASLTVEHKAREIKTPSGDPIKICPGQKLVSRSSLSELTGCSETSCKKYLKALIQMDVIDVEDLGQNGKLVTFKRLKIYRDYQQKIGAETPTPPQKQTGSETVGGSKICGVKNHTPQKICGVPPKTFAGSRNPSIHFSGDSGDIGKKRKAPKKEKPKREEIAKKLVALWKETCPDLPQPMGITKPRVSKANARWKENPDLEFWRSVFQRLQDSPYCRGEVEGKEDAKKYYNIDFALRDGQYAIILEGKYDHNKTRVQANTRGWQRENGLEELSESQKEVLRKRRPKLPHEYMGAQPDEAKRPGSHDPGGNVRGSEGDDQLCQVALSPSGVVQDRGV